eukprot:jgi/Phyca11/110086/e_gw1.17.634.1
MKNDQEGSRPRDPRHVYANPIMPEVCPVLGFAVYFAVLGFSNDAKLFSGGNQYSRFLKVLKRVLEGDFMQNVLEEYIRFEAAGDMVVGRYVSGLPFDSPKFAILPPFFATHSGDNDDKIELRKCIQFALDAVFPGGPPNLKMVCQFGLASLLYHKAFLQQTLPSTHLLFSLHRCLALIMRLNLNGSASVLSVEISKGMITLLQLEFLHTLG